VAAHSDNQSPLTAIIAAVQQRWGNRALWLGDRHAPRSALLATGFAALDTMLGGGVSAAAITEVLGDSRCYLCCDCLSIGLPGVSTADHPLACWCSALQQRGSLVNHELASCHCGQSAKAVGAVVMHQARTLPRASTVFSPRTLL
jgi:hypothetical protein